MEGGPLDVHSLDVIVSVARGLSLESLAGGGHLSLDKNKHNFSYHPTPSICL